MSYKLIVEDKNMTNLNTKCRSDMLIFLEAEKAEMEKYKWIESEKAGRDLGNEAIIDWIHKYAAQFRESYNKRFHGTY
jgi:hypothetical protein